jgi:hypothetical protein
VFGRFSGLVRVEATQLAEAAHIVGEILHPDLGLGPHQPNRAYQGAAHVVGLRSKDVFASDLHGGFSAIAALGMIGQRLAPIALAATVAQVFGQIVKRALCVVGAVIPAPKSGGR